MSSIVNNLSQKEQLAAKLIEIRPNVTAGDRSAYLSIHGGGKGKLSQYLNGKVHSVDTGMKMLEFFTPRIEERQKRLQPFSDGASKIHN